MSTTSDSDSDRSTEQMQHKLSGQSKNSSNGENKQKIEVNNKQISTKTPKLKLEQRDISDDSSDDEITSKKNTKNVRDLEKKKQETLPVYLKQQSIKPQPDSDTLDSESDSDTSNDEDAKNRQKTKNISSSKMAPRKTGTAKHRAAHRLQSKVDDSSDSASDSSDASTRKSQNFKSMLSPDAVSTPKDKKNLNSNLLQAVGLSAKKHLLQKVLSDNSTNEIIHAHTGQPEPAKKYSKGILKNTIRKVERSDSDSSDRNILPSNQERFALINKSNNRKSSSDSDLSFTNVISSTQICKREPFSQNSDSDLDTSINRKVQQKSDMKNVSYNIGKSSTQKISERTTQIQNAKTPSESLKTKKVDISYMKKEEISSSSNNSSSESDRENIDKNKEVIRKIEPTKNINMSDSSSSSGSDINLKKNVQKIDVSHNSKMMQKSTSIKKRSSSESESSEDSAFEATNNRNKKMSIPPKSSAISLKKSNSDSDESSDNEIARSANQNSKVTNRSTNKTQSAKPLQKHKKSSSENSSSNNSDSDTPPSNKLSSLVQNSNIKTKLAIKKQQLSNSYSESSSDEFSKTNNKMKNISKTEKRSNNLSNSKLSLKRPPYSDSESDTNKNANSRKQLNTKNITKTKELSKSSNSDAESSPKQNAFISQKTFPNKNFAQTILKQDLAKRVSSSSHDSDSETERKRILAMNKKVNKNRRESISSSNSSSDSSSSKKKLTSKKVTQNLGKVIEKHRDSKGNDKLKAFIDANSHLKIIDTTTSLRLEDLNEDEEVWLMQSPKDLNPELLVGKKLKLNDDSKHKLKLGSNKYECIFKHSEKLNLCLVASESARNNNLAAKIIKPIGSIVIHQTLKEKSPTETYSSEKIKVEPPNNLKVRHPIFGPNFKEKLKLNENIQNKLIGAELHRNKIEDKIKRKLKKAKIKQENNTDHGEMIFELLNQSKNNIQRSTKKRSNKSDDLVSNKKIKLEKASDSEDSKIKPGKKRRKSTRENFESARKSMIADIFQSTAQDLDVPLKHIKSEKLTDESTHISKHKKNKKVKQENIDVSKIKTKKEIAVPSEESTDSFRRSMIDDILQMTKQELDISIKSKRKKNKTSDRNDDSNSHKKSKHKDKTFSQTNNLNLETNNINNKERDKWNIDLNDSTSKKKNKKIKNKKKIDQTNISSKISINTSDTSTKHKHKKDNHNEEPENLKSDEKKKQKKYETVNAQCEKSFSGSSKILSDTEEMTSLKKHKKSKNKDKSTDNRLSSSEHIKKEIFDQDSVPEKHKNKDTSMYNTSFDLNIKKEFFDSDASPKKNHKDKNFSNSQENEITRKKKHKKGINKEESLIDIQSELNIFDNSSKSKKKQKLQNENVIAVVKQEFDHTHQPKKKKKHKKE